MITEVHETTKATPYELVFGQCPRTSLFPSEHGPNIVTEEQLDWTLPLLLLLQTA